MGGDDPLSVTLVGMGRTGQIRTLLAYFSTKRTGYYCDPL